MPLLDIVVVGQACAGADLSRAGWLSPFGTLVGSESRQLVQVGGDEDLPKGAVALLCMQNIDVLCHAALRARATGAFLACCLDKDILSSLSGSLSGQQVSVTMDGQDVVLGAAGAADNASGAPTAPPPAHSSEGLTAPPLDCPKYAFPALFLPQLFLPVRWRGPRASTALSTEA